jgi:hypothetical protein
MVGNGCRNGKLMCRLACVSSLQNQIQRHSRTQERAVEGGCIRVLGHQELARRPATVFQLALFDRFKSI